MVYHEIRIKNGKKLNYLVYNKRDNGKWFKKSKFIGTGEMDAKKIEELKKEFEIEMITDKKYPYLSKEQVIEIEGLKEIYNKKISKFSKEEFEKFEKAFFTELTYNSNAIEGNSLSLEETSLVLNENLSPKGKTMREVYEAKNHAKALKFIKEYDKELTEEFILSVHKIILENISENFAGRYRQNPVRVIGSDAKFSSPEKILQLIKNLMYWYDKNKKNYHVFELAVIFSMKLVSIHPFIDGNGRVSRLAMNFILKKNSYPWINVYMKQRAEYLRAVRKANDENYSEIISFLIKTLKENLQDFSFLE